MNKIVSIPLVVSCLSIFSVQGDVWSDSTKINAIYPSTGGLSFLTDEYSNTQLSRCDGGKRFFISRSHPNYEVMVSSLTTAFAAEKNVKLYIDKIDPTPCGASIDRFFVFRE